MENQSEIGGQIADESGYDSSFFARLGQMGFLQSFLVLFIVNVIGFYVGPILYAVTVVKFRLIEISETGFNYAAMQQYLTMANWTWLVCAMFSLSVLFLKGRWKLVFAFAPIAVPFVYDLLFLVRYM